MIECVIESTSIQHAGIFIFFFTFKKQHIKDSKQTVTNILHYNLHMCSNFLYFFFSSNTKINSAYYLSQALEFRTPLFPHLVPPAIMVWIFVWKYIFEPFIHILQHFVLQLSRSTNFCF